ncbi:ATP-dependent DNA helicase [Corynebacterium sp. ES2715-CONJ3]|uniref:ATP-dependent DNA helicase n=1 Tax=Corynebacterium sp. ES2715-CONJ3 TaxID=2974028 RepID=UPI0021697F0C|nr:ATP-dependent DNA helicase [Corynebacterium sp. ES2715-CONJ3]MCS4491526.1 ATP-dependent helicase [Corynebacterium sp. ES2715-CONJ3]
MSSDHSDNSSRNSRGEEIYAGYHQIPPNPDIRLTSPNSDNPRRSWSNDLFNAQQGIWRLEGPSGSGVTTLLLDTVAERIIRGHDPDSMMVIAASKEAAARLRVGLTARLRGHSFTSSSSIVRSVHSWAFAIVRDHMDEHLRLISGAEHDAVIRELLDGERARDGGIRWPDDIREAIGMVGFARGLRDFLLRAAERGLSPGDLISLGSRYQQPMWVAAGEFLREYEQVMSLGNTHQLSASELVSRVLEYDVESLGFEAVFVDDTQHLDPKSTEFIHRLTTRASFAVIAGDPHQSVFRFRGARPDFLREFPAENHLKLTDTHRVRLARESFSDDYRQGRIEMNVVASMEELRHVVADVVRRENLIHQIPNQEIAVIVRNSAEVDPIRRALIAAGVPVHTDAGALVLGEQPLVSALLLTVRAARDGVSLEELEDLLIGPIGGADPATLRRLLRGLRLAELRYTRAVESGFDNSTPQRRAMEVLADLLRADAAQKNADFEEVVTTVLAPREWEILSHIRSILEQARRPGSVEEVLWNIWEATGLGRHLLAVSLRGGAPGSQADRSLDAVMTLFDYAGDFAERRPHAGIDSFIAHIAQQELPTGVRDRRLSAPDAVTVLTAHATTGREWDTTIIAGVQEGSWPNTGVTGGIFGQEELVDLIDDGIEPGVPISRIRERIHEEQRLFDMATSRARQKVVIAAVDAPEADEVMEISRFLVPYLDMLEEQSTPDSQPPAKPDQSYQPAVADSTASAENLEEMGRTTLLSIPTVVAELRRVLIDPHRPAFFKEQAARHLARMAHAGIADAHPFSWWGSGGISSDKELTVTALSPSKIDRALHCPLLTMLGPLVVDSETSPALLKGILVHAYAEALARGMDKDRAQELLRAAYPQISDSAKWQEETHIQQWQETLDHTAAWIETNSHDAADIYAEIPVNVEVLPGVRLRGRIDRLKKTTDGAYHIYDFKTGSNLPSTSDADKNPQLCAYQLALNKGEIENGRVINGAGMDIEGASLIYVELYGARGTKFRSQVPKQEADLQEFADQLPPLMDKLRGPYLEARVSQRCDTCVLRNICPAHSTGNLTTTPTGMQL